MTLDWKNEEDYAYCNDLDANGWAFEFLRRNPGYKKDWEDFSKRKAALEKKYGAIKRADPNCYKDPLSHIYEPERRDGEIFNEWVNRVHPEAKEVKKTWFEDYYKAKWGLEKIFPSPSEIPNPSPTFVPLTEQFPLFPIYDEVGDYYWEEDEFALITVKPEFSVVVFDLSLPVNEQIEKAKGKLKELHKKLNEKNKNKKTSNTPGDYLERFKRYLRALDGKETGANAQAIGETLFPKTTGGLGQKDYHSKVGYDQLRYARPYVFSSYRGIAFKRLISGN